MNTSNFQFAFIGVIFCIVAIWATMFVGSKAVAVNVDRPPTSSTAICSCYNTNMFLSLDEFGVIRHVTNIVMVEEVIYTLYTLEYEGWVHGVVITASSKTSHQQVMSLTSSIKEKFNHLNIVWKSVET